MTPRPDLTPPPLTEKEQRLQRILKIVVAILTIAIIGVLGVMVATVLTGGHKKSAEKQERPAAPAIASGPAAAFGERTLALPAAATVAELAVGNGTLVLRYRTPAGSEGLVIIDLATGAERGRIKLVGTE